RRGGGLCEGPVPARAVVRARDRCGAGATGCHGKERGIVKHSGADVPRSGSLAGMWRSTMILFADLDGAEAPDRPGSGVSVAGGFGGGIQGAWWGTGALTLLASGRLRDDAR